MIRRQEPQTDMGLLYFLGLLLATFVAFAFYFLGDVTPEPRARLFHPAQERQAELWRQDADQSSVKVAELKGAAGASAAR